MSTLTIGIDPGQSGGIVTLYPNGTVLDMRVMPGPHELADYLESTHTWTFTGGGTALGIKELHVWLEKAQSMPKQGIASAFNYGRHFGELLGIVVTLGLKHTLVAPATWTRVMHAGTGKAKGKVRSLEAAQRLQPGEQWKPVESKMRKAHDGLVDAYLIAEYGRRQLNGAVS